MDGIFLILSAIIYFQLGLFLSGYFDENVPKPYMDEIFHIPQAQNYCLGNYNEVFTNSLNLKF
jgi:alpha-1,2-glucosyltransferase